MTIGIRERFKPKLVCFDLGGVLVHICHDWSQAYAAAGLYLRRGPSSPAILAKARDLLALFDTGDISLDEWADGMSLIGDRTYTPDEMKRAHHAFSQGERPGALALIDELHYAGIVTACLSNTNQAHWTRLVHRDAAGPLEGPPEYPAVTRLQHQIASHLLRVAKPDAAIYLRFEQLTGVRGSDILFFDDRTENVAAALNRGWCATRIDPYFDTIFQIRSCLRDEGLI
jgi:FMN phosphatase YigB (HAD superfamily)